VPIPKSLEFCNAIFSYPDDAFRTIARCSKASFHRLVSKIKNHRVFNNNSKMKQASVEMQLLIVLNRLGCDGNGASIDRTGLFFGRSVGTVEKFTDRIFEAILSLEKDYVFWPDAAERSDISYRMDINHGLKHAVGIVDGTPVNFYQKPGIDGEAYFNRKGRYAINLTLVCDDRAYIRYYVVGHTGPTPDNQILEQSRMLTEPDKFFSMLEYLLADAGYALGLYVCTPYRKPASLIEENHIFNVLFSSARVIIEHVLFSSCA
jgi:hypothetical protein